MTIPGRARTAILIAAVAAAYVGAAEFGFTLAFATKQVTAVWPPTGIALAALLLFGLRVSPGVALGAFVANALRSESLLTAAGIAAGNTLGPLFAAFVLRRLQFDGHLARVRDVLALVAVSTAAMTITATNGVANLALGGIVPWRAYGSVWWVWWTGDALGAIVVAPFVLTFVLDRGTRLGRRRIAELAALLGLVVVVGYVAFFGRLLGPNARLEYAVFPLVIWSGLRFGPRTATTLVLAVAAFAITSAIRDRGPFAAGTLDQRLLLLDIFLAMVTFTALALGASTAERRRARRELEQAHEQLERRVVERTSELAAVNAALVGVNSDLTQRTTELAQKNEEVEAFVYIVSHDLRAPLVNLQGFSKELERSCRELTEAVRQAGVAPALQAKLQPILTDDIGGALRFISASTTKFQRLIEALLTLSRSGRQEYRADDVDVGALVQTTLDSLRQTVAACDAEISCSALPHALGDVTALGQVFSNLVANAVKYRDPGRRLAIEISGERRGTTVEYTVRDNGLGIPSSARARLFQVFQRFHPDAAEGDGMGLATVKRVIERHGGRIWVDSEEGRGSAFRFALRAPLEARGS